MARLKEQTVSYHYYKDLWENPQPAPILSSPDVWDKRADEWVQILAKDVAYQARMMERVDATTAFLRKNGLLGPNSNVLDIGCGSGLFTTMFAKTAGHVTGVDISPRMVCYTQDYAQNQGAKNTSFRTCDFKQADMGVLGWHKKFDLVMTCLTPAITNVYDLHKIMGISRGH